MSAVHPVFDPFIKAMHSLAVPASCMRYPYVVSVTYQLPADAATRQSVQIIERMGDDRPIAHDALPAGTGEDAEVIGGYVCTVDDLLATKVEHRQGKRAEYKAFLMWLASRRCGKPVAEMRGWKDFDPIDIDERLESWLRPGRYCGD